MGRYQTKCSTCTGKTFLFIPAPNCATTALRIDHPLVKRPTALLPTLPPCAVGRVLVAVGRKFRHTERMAKPERAGGHGGGVDVPACAGSVQHPTPCGGELPFHGAGGAGVPGPAGKFLAGRGRGLPSPWMTCSTRWTGSAGVPLGRRRQGAAAVASGSLHVPLQRRGGHPAVPH